MDQEVAVSVSVRSLSRTRLLWSSEALRDLLIIDDIDVVLSADQSVTPLAEAGDPPSDCVELAIFAVRCDGAERGYEALSQYAIDPTRLEGKRFADLGFDVVDEGQLSPLMTMRSEELSTWDLVDDLRGQLNRYQLFEKLADADAFRARADKAIWEHAPLCVVAVRKVIPAPEG